MINRLLDAWDNVFDKIEKIGNKIKNFALKPAHMFLKWEYVSFFIGAFWFAVASASMVIPYFKSSNSEDVFAYGMTGLMIGTAIICSLSLVAIVLTYITASFVNLIKLGYSKMTQNKRKNKKLKVSK